MENVDLFADDELPSNVQEELAAKVWGPLYRTIDAAYELSPLNEIVSLDHVVGVSRLYYLPTFAPEDVITCTFFADAIRLDIVRGASSFQLADDHPFDPTLVCRRSYHLASKIKALGVLSSWERFRDYAIQAPSCSTSTLDGIGYRHTFHDGYTLHDFHWANPEPKDHPNQMQLLKAYGRCVWAGRIRCWMPKWRFWRSRLGRWGP